jgi:hypothetical protein
MESKRPPPATRAPSTGSPLARWLPLLGVGALLGAAAVAATLSSPQLTRVPLPRQRAPTATPLVVPSYDVSGSPSPEPSEVPQDRSDFALPSWLSTLATLLCAAALLAIVVALIWYIVRDYMPVRRPAPVVEPSEPDRLTARAEDVVAAVDAGLVDLFDADSDPRRAIIACWLRLEDAAAAAGTPREIGDTSTDLVVRLLRAHRVSREVLDSFAQVYRVARYGTGPVDDRMRTTAVSALGQLRAELAADASARAEADRVAAEQAAAERAAERSADGAAGGAAGPVADHRGGPAARHARRRP